MKTYVLDTNIILDDPSNLVSLYDNGNNTIVLPEIVIDELDAKKSGFDDINYNARQFARLLEESEIIDKAQLEEFSIITTHIKELDMDIRIISKASYICEDSTVALSILNDRKILELAQDYNNVRSIVFLSLDIMCRTRALALGLTTETLKGKDQVIDYQFHKELNIGDMASLNGKNILEIDADYKNMNFSYTLIDTNGQHHLGQVQNGHFYLIPEKVPRKRFIQPLNKEQKFFINAIEEGYADILMIDAKAGSGKSLLSIAAAMSLVAKKQYTNIVYIRNSIESLDKGEDVGYLPGHEEKFAIYNHPLHDTLKNIATTEIQRSNKNRTKANALEEDTEAIATKVAAYIETYKISTMWPGEMRGRTLSNAFVIIDEAQNMSAKTMQLVLSRLDKTCKVVVIGSNKQIDNMYTNKYINGMSTLIKATNDQHEEVKLWAGELNKVLRGPITEFAERIFSK